MADLNGLKGNEIADDFTRKGTDQGRWKATWEVFKSNFWKLLVINLATLVFFSPAIAVIYIRGIYAVSLGLTYPFNASIGYPYYPNEYLTGLAQNVNLSIDLVFYALLIAAGIIASIGIAGATYCIRKLLQTGGEVKVKNYFHGIKVGFFNTVLPVTIFLVFIYSTVLVKDWMELTLATGGNAAGAITAYVFIIIATVLAGIYLLWVFAVGVSYRVKMKYLFRNALVLVVGTPVHTVVILGVTFIPVWLILLGGFWAGLSYALLMIIGLSFMLVCWLAFTQWAFDQYITPVIKTAKELRANKSEKELAAERAAEEKQQALELLAAGKSELISRPILPITSGDAIPRLGKTFTRAQISDAADSRARLESEVAAYENAHKNDPAYKEYNKMFAEREKVLAEPKGKKNRNRISSDNLLK